MISVASVLTSGEDSSTNSYFGAITVASVSTSIQVQSTNKYLHVERGPVTPVHEQLLRRDDLCSQRLDVELGLVHEQLLWRNHRSQRLNVERGPVDE